MPQSIKGFTLIEMAIVLVIMGLLLGGVLKGQEMIESSKIANLRSDFEGISAAVYAYRDRYRCLPGDDLRATRWNGATPGNCDGDLEESSDAFDDGPLGLNERGYFWRHLRHSGLLKGDPLDNTHPMHAFGGQWGVVTGNGAAPLGLMGQVVLCADRVPLKAAEAIDSQMDDGLPIKGEIRAMATAAAYTDPGSAPAQIYSETSGDYYVVCATL